MVISTIDGLILRLQTLREAAQSEQPNPFMLQGELTLAQCDLEDINTQILQLLRPQ